MSQPSAQPPIQAALHFPDQTDLQTPSDVAVVMPTLLRPSLLRAVASVFQQDQAGRIHLMIGVDVAQGPAQPLLDLLAQRPGHVSATLLHLPYSTSARHGGVHTALDGGALRSILSLMANARRLAYLDDDNTWLPQHLAHLKRAAQGKAWAFAPRWLVDEDTEQRICVDQWDSVGVDRGRFAAQGGFVDTNCLLIDKVVCAKVLGRWSDSGSGGPGLTADRHFFSGIRQAPHGQTAEATVLYRMRRTNVLWRFIAQARASSSST